jgi:hypothetical protein
MEGADLALLHRLVAMGSRSLLQYVCQAFPWSADRSGQAVAKIQEIAAEERDATARLTRHLQKKRVRLPPTMSFPSHFTTINFVSIDYLLPKLIAEHESEVAELEGRLAVAQDEEVRDLAQHYLDRKRRDLQTLKDLKAKAPAA